MPTAIRVSSYNVLCGEWAKPEEFANVLDPLALDQCAFCEVPAEPWTTNVGRHMHMPYAYTGCISTAGHEDKYKSILSRFPLFETREILIEGSRWGEHCSAVRAVTDVRGTRIAFYSLHIPKNPSTAETGADFILNRLLPDETEKNFILAGDFNFPLGHESHTYFNTAGLCLIWDELSIDPQTASTLMHAPDRIIDHIIYPANSSIRAEEGGIIETEPMISDHKPIWAELIIG